MIYCTAESMSSPVAKAEIAFPYQVEIRVNQDEVKSNLRGLKNKPGSTRPADITNLLRKRAGYENHLVVTYALTQKVCPLALSHRFPQEIARAIAVRYFFELLTTRQKFFIVVNLVEQNPVEELVTKLKSGKLISRERVIRESEYCTLPHCTGSTPY